MKIVPVIKTNNGWNRREDIGWLGLTSDKSYAVGYCRWSGTHPQGLSGDILSQFTDQRKLGETEFNQSLWH